MMPDCSETFALFASGRLWLELATRQLLDLVLRTLKVAFTVSSEIGLRMQYRPSKSANSKTDHPSAF